MILEAVGSILESSTELTDIIGDQLYSIYIDQDAKGNIVGYNAITRPSRTKSAPLDENQVEIACISTKYRITVDMINIIRRLFRSSAVIFVDDNITIRGAEAEEIIRSHDPIHKEYQQIIRINLKSKTL